MIKIIDTKNSEEVEPHPELVSYFQETQKLISLYPKVNNILCIAESA